MQPETIIPTIIQRPIQQLVDGSLNNINEQIANEIPVALVYNGISHVVLMATPQNLAELALGFSLSESILHNSKQLYDLDMVAREEGIEIQMQIASECFAALKNRRRSMAGRTGCGLCGIDSLSAAMPCLPVLERTQIIRAADIQAALMDFEQHQPLRAQTGSLHAVAWVEQGYIQAAFEDVGRHNALDKLIGYLVKQNIDFQKGFLLTSSRASYEMVAKSAVAGIGCMVAVSAATDLAVQMAHNSNITLIGFARPKRQSIYTHAQYIQHYE